MPHSFKYSEENIKLLETVIGRLKYSVSPSILIKWLENFNENEIPIALNVLRYFEYIDSNELLLRLDYLLKELISNIGNSDEKVLFFPFAKYGKSSTLITYPLTHLDRFKKNEKRFVISNDLLKTCREHTIKHIVFIDDFVGSGGTFIKEFRNVRLFLESLSLNNSMYLLCPVIMEKAKEKITKEITYIKILSEERFKFLESDFSAINLSTTKEEIKNLIVSYGNQIPVNPPPDFYSPKGYRESESLISFFYRTPNNTFPVIWGDKNWSPLYPRTSKGLIKHAKHLKKDISYYLNSFFNSNLEFELKEDLIDHSEDERDSKTIISQKNNYLLLAILVLKYKTANDLEKTNLFICNFLGLTREELNNVYTEGENKKYIQKTTKNLTDKGKDLVSTLFSARKRASIRNISHKNLEINYTLYLPTTFRGSS